MFPSCHTFEHSRHARLRSGAIVLLLLIHTLVRAADTTLPQDEAYAWSRNTGWISLHGDGTHGVEVGSHYLSGHAWSANLGWISFGSGLPTNGHSYANTSTTDFGINHDGLGHLTGMAYGANIGWINFGWADAENADTPRFDLQTGTFSGFVWSASTGWINLGTGLLRTASVTYADTDLDGIADAWEHQWFGSVSIANESTDSDQDGASDLNEFLALSDPLSRASLFRILTHQPAPGGSHMTLSFTSQPGRFYRAQVSGDLQNWFDSDQGLILPDSGSSTARTVRTIDPTRTFVRVQALLPLQP